MTTFAEQVQQPLLDAVREIDDFRRAVDDAGEGTDPEAAWELIGSLRAKLAQSLDTMGVEVEPYEAIELGGGAPRP